MQTLPKYQVSCSSSYRPQHVVGNLRHNLRVVEKKSCFPPNGRWGALLESAVWGGPAMRAAPAVFIAMAFPATRLRRLRRTEQLRSLVRETRLAPDALV